MENNYITTDDTIIFSPKYNKPLDIELNIQPQYKKIIFSDYELNNYLFEAYEIDYLQNFQNLKPDTYKGYYFQNLPPPSF